MIDKDIKNKIIGAAISYFVPILLTVVGGYLFYLYQVPSKVENNSKFVKELRDSVQINEMRIDGVFVDMGIFKDSVINNSKRIKDLEDFLKVKRELKTSTDSFNVKTENYMKELGEVKDMMRQILNKRK